MKYIAISILSVCFWGSCLAQPALMANDTARVYYSKTDFYSIDSLELWSYYVNKDVVVNAEDSLTPAYELTFKRVRSVNHFDTGIRELDKYWETSIMYKVYRLRDSNYCYNRSRQIRARTNFVPPYAGGDYFIIGKFIFLNTDVCVGCIQYRTGTDFCRPVVNELLSAIDMDKPYSIEGIVRQFPIKRMEFDNTNYALENAKNTNPKKVKAPASKSRKKRKNHR